MANPLLLGHRGQCDTRSVLARRLRPGALPSENTIAAFELALQRGCDGFEFDVRFTGDGHSVVCHDPDLAGYNLANSEHRPLLESMRARGIELLSLADVLARFASRAWLDIEIKVPGFEHQVLDALRQNPPQCGYVVSSFLPGVLLRIRELGADLPLGFICKDRKLLPKWRDLPVSFVIPHHKLVVQSLVDEWHEEGKQVLVWTVNRRGDILRLREWAVDGIISDKTAGLLSLTTRVSDARK